MFELLAPAGDLEKLKIAFLYGADAVYIGGQNFSLRANAKNFSFAEIKEAVEYAHKLSKKVYVTVNIVFHNEDIEGLDDYLIFLDKIKVDGIIVSDILILKRLKHLKLNLFVVLSTQTSVLNSSAVKFWQSLGVKRIVLAREASKEDIKSIINDTKIEVEVFIHGSMCISHSGKCVLSNVTTNRDANRGGCAQVCRWCFRNEGNPDFTMMPKDLNMINNIDKLMELGVVSYKVEGRMRSIYYIATIIDAYRNIFDKIINKSLTDNDKLYYLNILNRCANRESKDQFFNSKTSYEDQYFSAREEITNKDFLGIVKDYDMKTNIATIEQRNYFKKGEIVEFLCPNEETFSYQLNIIYDDEMNEIDVAHHPQMTVKVKVLKPLSKFSMMRKKII